MPTIIVLDVSLSMARPVTVSESGEEFQRRHLAIHGVNTLLDFLVVNAKMEFVSLVCYSYYWEQMVPFTRDYDAMRAALGKVELYNKTCIEVALTGVSTIVQEEWGAGIPCQVILVTDGNSGIGAGSLKRSLQNYNRRESKDAVFPLPFPFPAKLNVLCVANPGDSELKTSLPLFQKLIDINDQGGDLYVPDGPLSIKSVQEMFQTFAAKNYTPFLATLGCGNFKCPVQLHPRPEPFDSDVCREADFQCLHTKISDKLDILGFLDIADVASPATISRHLVLPISTRDKGLKSEANGAEDGSKAGASKEEEEDSTEDGRIPSFAVLLHGSLKVESMVAITKISEKWFGMLYSWADSKKKSNLMLSVFEPGLENIAWLGNMDNLAPSSMVPDPSLLAAPGQPPPPPLQFPVKAGEKRSYAQSCVVWIKDVGLQSDMQKVLRNARKLPEKQQHFYKEMNRIRRAALSFGFLELLEAIALMLERECTLLPGTAHPNAAIQLTHAANALRLPSAKDISHTIMPLQTNFSGDR